MSFQNPNLAMALNRNAKLTCISCQSNTRQSGIRTFRCNLCNGNGVISGGIPENVIQIPISEFIQTVNYEYHTSKHVLSKPKKIESKSLFEMGFKINDTNSIQITSKQDLKFKNKKKVKQTKIDDFFNKK